MSFNFLYAVVLLFAVLALLCAWGWWREYVRSSRRRLRRESFSSAELNEFSNASHIITDCMLQMVTGDDYEKMADFIISTIGSSIGADRCAIFHATPDGNFDCGKMVWHAPGVKPFDNRLVHISSHSFRHWLEQLEHSHYIFCESPADTSGLSTEAKSLLTGQGLQSVIWCGIYSHGSLTGFLCIGFLRRRIAFSPTLIRMAQGACTMLALASELSRRLDSLNASHAIQKCILETLPIPLMLVDSDYNIIHTGRALNEIAGLDASRLHGNICLSGFCGMFQPDAECPVMQTFQDGLPHAAERRIAGREFQLKTAPYMANGRLAGVFICFIDVTESNTCRRLLEKAAVDAETAARAKSDFLATMSHELRTPLNAIIGFADLLRLDHSDPAVLDEALTSINVAGNALLELINDILDLSKIEAGRMVIIPVRMRLETLLDELHRLFRLKLAEKQLDFKLPELSGMPVLKIDRIRLRQILLNLIGNAVKFTESGSIAVEAEFTPVDENSGTLILRVRDSGVGITPDYAKTIFEPFVQDVSTNRRQVGTGLGLAICRRLATQMGGELTCVSTPGCGSCFSLSLEHVGYDRQPLDIAPEEPAAAAPLSGRVLIVDDVDLNRKVLSAAAKKLGLTTCSAASGGEALELMENFMPDLVLTDVAMPEMDGAELAGRIHSDRRFSGVSVIAVSAEPVAADETGKCAFDDFLLKPVTIKELDALFRRRLGAGIAGGC